MAGADKSRTPADVASADQRVRGDQLTRTQEARGYSWPPFEVENLAAAKHGADSPRLVSPIVDELTEWAIDQAPWLAMPVFAPTLARWAWAEAETILRRQHLDAHGIVDAKSDGFERRQRVEDRGDRIADKLGMGPTALAKLLGLFGSIDGAASTEGLEALKAAGREAAARAAEQRALASPGVPEPERRDDEAGQRGDQGGNGNE